MVNIYCDAITQELKDVAREIADRQKENVNIITPTVTLEVVYEKVSEVPHAKGEKDSQQPCQNQES